jgi:hypothetical protein
VDALHFALLRFLRALSPRHNMAMIGLHLNGPQVFWNHVMEQQTGFAASEVLGKVPVEVLGFNKCVRAVRTVPRERNAVAVLTPPCVLDARNVCRDKHVARCHYVNLMHSPDPRYVHVPPARGPHKRVAHHY